MNVGVGKRIALSFLTLSLLLLGIPAFAVEKTGTSGAQGPITGANKKPTLNPTKSKSGAMGPFSISNAPKTPASSLSSNVIVVNATSSSQGSAIKSVPGPVGPQGLSGPVGPQGQQGLQGPQEIGRAHV